MVSSLRIRKIFSGGVFKRFPKQMSTNGGFLKKGFRKRVYKGHFTVQPECYSSLSKGFPYHFASVN